MDVDTGANVLLSSLSAAGICICFANPGTTEMHLCAALDNLQGRIQPILCLHENAATGAADGFARMTGRPAAVILHLGPGLANGIANLHNARRARSPICVLVGDMATWHAQADPVLSMDITAIAAAVSERVIRFQTSQEADSSQPLEAAADFIVHETPGIQGRFGSHIVTMIIPHDASWLPGSSLPTASAVRAAFAGMGERCIFGEGRGLLV